jgi:hypothetical protein
MEKGVLALATVYEFLVNMPLKFEAFITEAFITEAFSDRFWCNNVSLGAKWRRAWNERGSLSLFLPL